MIKIYDDIKIPYPIQIQEYEIWKYMKPWPGHHRCGLIHINPRFNGDIFGTYYHPGDLVKYLFSGVVG